jgi:drug/metabolite transporter (DMT)-like permease
VIPTALVAAFASGLAWAGLDIARKTLARDLRPSVVAAGLTLGQMVLFGAWSIVTRPTVRLDSYLLPAVLSIVLGAGVQILIVESVRRSELSRTIPLLSFTPVATMLFGVVVLGEMPSATQWLGILLVLLGGLGLGLSRLRSDARSGFSFDRGSGLMLAAALLISAAAPFDKLAVAASEVEFHGFLQSAGIGALLIAFLVVRGNLSDLGRSFRTRPALTVAAFIALAAVGLQFTAYQGAMVGVVETVKRVIGLGSSLAAGYLVFRERVTRAKVASLIVMAVGVGLML